MRLPAAIKIKGRGRKRDPLGTLARLDRAGVVALRTHGHTPTGEQTAKALGRFGEWGAGWVAIGAAAAALDRERRGAWRRAAAIAPIAVLLNYTVKVAVRRQRPVIGRRPRLASAPSQFSFPSAHATSSMAAATAMGRVAPKARPALYTLALTISAGRLYLGMHYPSDVIAGLLLGRAIGRELPLPGVYSGEIWAR